ncbi:hypothetical protein ACFRMO_07810 [Streptomyces anulatus]|uniref:hypothetical protein n=1 Tax=Streptomyces anulatus TaxID=1892 RepID=UPI003683A176
MGLDIAVEEILARVPARARTAYTNLITHENTRYDADTGWSCAYVTQQGLADDMKVSLRTATRAVNDLRRIGVLRVHVWPGAVTETQVRVSDVPVASIFGPVRMAQRQMPHQQLVDWAIRLLVQQNCEFEDALPEGE